MKKLIILMIAVFLGAAPLAQATDQTAPYLEKAVDAGLISPSYSANLTMPISRQDFTGLMTQALESVTGQSLADTMGDDLPNPFTDTESLAVRQAYALGIVNGLDEQRFDPEGTLTREQAAKITALTAVAVGREADQEDLDLYPYEDWNQISAWARPYIRYVTAAGIMTGTSEGNFSPDAPFTHQQAVITAVRLYEFMTGE